jgi:hypothetical protein
MRHGSSSLFVGEMEMSWTLFLSLTEYTRKDGTDSLRIGANLENGFVYWWFA